MFFRDNCVLLLPVPNPLSSSSPLLHNLSTALYLSVAHFSLIHPTPSVQPVNRKSSIHTLDSPISHGSEQGLSVEHLLTKQVTTMEEPKEIEAKCKKENNIGSECAQLPSFGIDAMERSRRLQDLKQRRIREWKVVVDVRNRQSNRLLY